MPRRTRHADDDDDEDSLDREGEPWEADPDDPDPSDMDDEETGDEPAVVPCPYCGEEISEDAEVCPQCRSFISAEDAPPARKPWYVVAGAVALLAAVVLSGWLIYRY